MAVFIFGPLGASIFFFINDKKSSGEGILFEFSLSDTPEKYFGILISEAEEEEGVLNSKLEWI